MICKDLSDEKSVSSSRALKYNDRNNIFGEKTKGLSSGKKICFQSGRSLFENRIIHDRSLNYTRNCILQNSKVRG